MQSLHQDPVITHHRAVKAVSATQTAPSSALSESTQLLPGNFLKN